VGAEGRGSLLPFPKQLGEDGVPPRPAESAWEGRWDLICRPSSWRSGGLQWATSKAAVESVLGWQEGVASVEANAVAQTATVAFDPRRTSVAAIAGWIRDCGYHCRGLSVPEHLCYPMEPAPAAGHEPAPATPHTRRGRTTRETMGHGGHHAGMSMAGMVREMRSRSLVAAVPSLGVMLFSPMGRGMLGFTLPGPRSCSGAGPEAEEPLALTMAASAPVGQARGSGAGRGCRRAPVPPAAGAPEHGSALGGRQGRIDGLRDQGIAEQSERGAQHSSALPGAPEPAPCGGRKGPAGLFTFR
jgi:copper chaperone CopZ